MTELSSTEILQDILNIPGTTAAVIVGRDGFVIETAGTLQGIDMDTLGASVAMVLTGAESMGAELNLSAFHTMTLESEDATIICTPVGEALLVLVAPNSKTLGMIRMQLKKKLPSLVELF
jgi:predicted regulator of Ras-like GTPase activity (Roadblock/LC7/MglB family)